MAERKTLYVGEDEFDELCDPMYRMIHGLDKFDLRIVDGSQNGRTADFQAPASPVTGIRNKKEQVGNSEEVKPPRVGKCSICNHPDLRFIRESRTWGWSLRRIAENYGVGYGSLFRHFRDCEGGKIEKRVRVEA